MQFKILGAAAGGGLPQWNCGCVNCRDARSGKIAQATQSSLAVSVDGLSWAVLNASPDIRQQIYNSPQLHPRDLRHSPISSVLMTNGDIDHIAGLLSLREQSPFTAFATAEILGLLRANPIFAALNPEKVRKTAIRLDHPFALLGGLEARLFAVAGKVPLYMEGDSVQTDLIGEQTVGVRLSAGGKVAYYIPGCAVVSDDLIAQISDADLLFFDGTVWDDDEMIRTGTGVKTGRRMGHVPMIGARGSLERLRGITAQKHYIHINNTNPVWQDSAERAAVQAAGWGICYDGQEITL